MSNKYHLFVTTTTQLKKLSFSESKFQCFTSLKFCNITVILFQ